MVLHPYSGSREWIGAIELSYVLQERYDVACKILTVASGAELPSKAREIARHFSTQVCAHARLTELKQNLQSHVCLSH